LEELREVMAWVRANRKGRDVIIGGDFNCPPDRIMMFEMERLARDAFGERGRGWGGTAINTFPMVRIDQIWVGGNIIPKRAEARTTKNSDHRMVIVTAYGQS
jgi:endonuclease/exonuclease/phosphatase (EEP) superfamily protein YafD